MLSTEQLKEKMKEYLEKAGYDAQDPEKSKHILQKVCNGWQIPTPMRHSIKCGETG